MHIHVLSYSQNDKNGKEFINLSLVKKEYNSAYSYFDKEVQTQITLPVLQQTIELIEEQLGQFKKIIEINHQKSTFFFYSEFEKAKLDIQITFNNENKIVGFYFIPHKDFENNNSLNIKSDSLELKGTFLQSIENDQKKLVIFVHGSGPQDRNETIGENKPFKDIAEYLYNNGISSYRYDKRTYSYPELFTDKSTVEEETINDVVNVTNYFKSNEKFKDYQIIILGHSLGAYLIPQIAKKIKISKYIFLAGNSRPLQDLIIEQFEYINKIEPSKISAQEVKNIKRQVDFLNSNKFNLNTKKTELPLGLSAYYWKYLLDYKPLEDIKSIQVPMLFMQGGKDYQVTQIDFNLWKKKFKNNKKIIFKFYPTLNHLFIENTEKIPSPKDYEKKGNINENVLKDLKDFILN
ncbi:hypothetical protein SAMN05880574_12933 [Chryseobacterium sp. RU37D]|uniref:alpha/beta hydrolase n=1 Tax=Chryseobacterium sp. RU37D TaxID=1907397 RepID=UPI00095514B1|nr:DUF3887 domain-containing protein [Chryseobacterium sp. RU37D]SIQ86501.1 hypothetical protein SAMN05880574_12933 [Chryseobacterium sp. RU37D]